MPSRPPKDLRIWGLKNNRRIRVIANYQTMATYISSLNKYTPRSFKVFRVDPKINNGKQELDILRNDN